MDGRITIAVWWPQQPSITADIFSFSSFNNGPNADILTRECTGSRTNIGMSMREKGGASPTRDPSSGNMTKRRSNGISRSKEQSVPTMGICCIGANDSELIPYSTEYWENFFRSKLANVAGVNSSFKRETLSKLIISPRAAKEEERH